MRALPLVILLALSGPAHAADLASGSGFSMVGSFLQMLAALAIVIGVIFFAQHMINRLLKGNLVKKSVPRYIRVVESRFLAPKKSLMLVEVGGEYLLLGTTDSGVNLIKQIDMLESIEVVEDLSAPPRPGMVWPDALQTVAELLRKKFAGFGRAEKRMV